MASLPLDLASLASIWLESILYGAVLPLYGGAVYIIFRRRAVRGLNKPMLAAATLMTLLATLHVAFNLQRLVDGFINNQTTPNGPNDYFNQLRDPMTAGKYVVFTLQTVVGDVFNIYRLYLVWKRSWRVILLPLLIFVGSTTTSTVSLSFMLSQGGGPVLAPQYTSVRVNTLITAFLALLMVQPIVTSSLIAARLLLQDRKLMRGVKGSGSLLPVARIVLDSAAAYGATMLTLVVLFVCGNTAFFIVLEAVVPVIAITFCSVIARVAAHTSKLDHNSPAAKLSKHSTVSQHARQPIAGDLPHAWGKRSQSGSSGEQAMSTITQVATERMSGMPNVGDELEERRGDEEWDGEDATRWSFAEDRCEEPGPF